jgi:hypothetical protein
MGVIRLLPILIAAAAGAQTVQVENTGKLGRRVENRYYIAALPDPTGALSTLTIKDPGVTLQRVNSRLNKTLMIRRVGEANYQDQAIHWNPVQNFRDERKDGMYITRREGYLPKYPEVKIACEYRFPADAPYFLVATSMTVEKPIRVDLLRNNEMTMDLFFTSLAWSGSEPVGFDARKPLPIDVPWLTFLNPAKGYGYGFVNLGYKAAKTANPGVVISDGYVSESNRTVNARYWHRDLVTGAEVDLVPGDRFEELTAYVVFRSSEKSPLGDFPEWEKRIRAAVSVR